MSKKGYFFSVLPVASNNSPAQCETLARQGGWATPKLSDTPHPVLMSHLSEFADLHKHAPGTN